MYSQGSYLAIALLLIGAIACDTSRVSAVIAE
jgi:hypothetical protein